MALFQRTHPDLVLLDVRLPDMTGFDVLGRLRGNDPVVIMITAYGDVPLAVQAMQNGAENFLTKPVELAHLGAAAERAFEKSRLRQMNRYLTTRHGHGDGQPVLGTFPSDAGTRGADRHARGKRPDHGAAHRRKRERGSGRVAGDDPCARAAPAGGDAGLSK